MFILTLSHTPRLPSWPELLQALTLVASPRLGLQQGWLILLWFCCNEAIAFFYGGVVKKKKKTITSITFFDGFVAKNGNSNYHRLFQWIYCEEGDTSNVVAFFYGGGVLKKTMVTNNRLFFLFWSFWSSSLEFIINNEMVVFFYVEGCNG